MFCCEQKKKYKPPTRHAENTVDIKKIKIKQVLLYRFNLHFNEMDWNFFLVNVMIFHIYSSSQIAIIMSLFFYTSIFFNNRIVSKSPVLYLLRARPWLFWLLRKLQYTVWTVEITVINLFTPSRMLLCCYCIYVYFAHRE